MLLFHQNKKGNQGVTQPFLQVWHTSQSYTWTGCNTRHIATCEVSMTHVTEWHLNWFFRRGSEASGYHHPVFWKVLGKCSQLRQGIAAWSSIYFNATPSSHPLDDRQALVFLFSFVTIVFQIVGRILLIEKHITHEMRIWPFSTQAGSGLCNRLHTEGRTGPPSVSGALS